MEGERFHHTSFSLHSRQDPGANITTGRVHRGGVRQSTTECCITWDLAAGTRSQRRARRGAASATPRDVPLRRRSEAGGGCKAADHRRRRAVAVHNVTYIVAWGKYRDDVHKVTR
jgi:hypothetical protein